MSLPYFPMFPTDFEAKTSHLTLEEDGAYNRLLRLMWMTPGCSLPDDDAWIMRRMRVDRDTYERVVLVVIDEFCDRENGRVSNAKLMRVFEESSESHKRRVLAGAMGGRNKSLKNNGNTTSNAKAKPKQPEPEPDTVSKDTGATAPIDPEKVMFDAGRALLAKAGKSRDVAGRLLGKWRKDHGTEAVIAAISKAEREGAIDPVSYIEGCLRFRAKKTTTPEIGERREFPGGRVKVWGGAVDQWVEEVE